jgi:tetratricopeptide (TPR) repeat protein
MSNVAKLKKKAIEFEQKKQFDKALALYVQILDNATPGDEDADGALYNRVGDLMLRQGSIASALDYYERAVDLYAEGGFFNNAIALCNKILRNSPGRNSIYYKLGKISAKKGFTSDAKQNFLEYADRMQKAGRMDEAFRALKEFADLCPDQDDVRLMLAEQLSKRERKGEAMEQLQTLYSRLESEGRTLEARATADRMKAIDPSAQPKAAPTERPQKPGDLVFLDVDYDQPARSAPPPKAPPGRGGRAEPAAPSADLPFIDVDPKPAPRKPAPEPKAMPQAPRQPAPEPKAPPPAPPPVEPPAPPPPVAGFEPSMTGSDITGIPDVPPDATLGLEPTAFGADFGSDSFVTFGDDAASLLGSFEVAEQPAPEDTVVAPIHDLVLPGELPVLDVPDFNALDGVEAPPAVAPDAPPPPPEQSTHEMLAELEAPFERPPEGSQPPPLPTVELEVQKDDAAFLTVPNQSRPGGARESIEALMQMLSGREQDPSLRRRLGEALLEHGDRAGGLQELEVAMIGFERVADYESARSVADEVIRLDPNSIRHHQKRVQYAYQANDTPRLVEAYLELADALFRSGQPEKARAVYQRVLELAPDDIRAQAALSAFVDAPPATPPTPAAPMRAPSGAVRRYSANVKRQSVPAPAAPPKPPRSARPAASADTVNLGELVRDEDVPKSTRMVVEEQAPTGDEQADFADMLRKFKRGLAENLEEEDYQSHYDLGVAFKEMGLLDEAIAEFQKALRGTEQRIRTYEALGQCFLERSQFDVAATILERAVTDGRSGDEQLVGVLYLLGYASEALDRYDAALGYYQRVFSVDIQFRDVAERIRTLERVAK